MRKIITVAVLLFLSAASLPAQKSKDKTNPVGNWKFEAPMAPEGYTSGAIVVGLSDKEYSLTISFTGSDYKIPAEQVKVENDTVTCSIYVEGEYVKINMKQDSYTKMTGTATYSGGGIPFTLTRNISQK